MHLILPYVMFYYFYYDLDGIVEAAVTLILEKLYYVYHTP